MASSLMAAGAARLVASVPAHSAGGIDLKANSLTSRSIPVPLTFTSNRAAFSRIIVRAEQSDRKSFVDDPAGETKKSAEETGAKAQKLGNEFAGEAQARGQDAIQDARGSVDEVGSRVRGAADEVQRGAKEAADRAGNLTSSAGDQLKKDNEEIKKQAGDAFNRDDTKDVVSEVSGNVQGGVKNVRNTADQASDQAGNVLDKTAATLQDAGSALKNSVSETAERLANIGPQIVNETKEWATGSGREEAIDDRVNKAGQVLDENRKQVAGEGQKVAGKVEDAVDRARDEL